jgi:DNA-directed RNA polymerase specialized sigma24 family protein
MPSLPDDRGAFPPTRHSAILGLGAAEAGERERARTLLAETYWKPVYTHLRLRWQRNPEDAADLTQGFFLAALEKDFLSGYDPARARFRTFLRVCLDRHVQRADEAAGRIKRGGAAEHLRLDFAAAEASLPADGAPGPDALFDREWLRALLEQGVAALRTHCEARDRALDFRLFARRELAPDGAPRPGYRELAEAEGVSETTVTNRLAAARRDFRRLLLERLRAITSSEAEFREEARAVLGAEPE